VSETGGEWKAFWADGADGRTRAATSPELRTFWADLFARSFDGRTQARMLDIATGPGILIEHALAYAADQDDRFALHAVGSDLSEHAGAKTLRSSDEGRVNLVVADAAQPPFAESTFDLVASQFGVEYAGLDAVMAAAGHLAPGGRLALVMHLAGGDIEDYCRACADLLGQVKTTGVFACAYALLNQARDVLDGKEHDRDRAQALEQEFVAARDQLLRSMHAASQEAMAVTPFLARMLNDLNQLCARRYAYAPPDALNWVQHQEREVEVYRRRMQSMLEAAQTPEDLGALQTRLEASGFESVRYDKVVSASHGNAFAWRLEAVRAG